MQQPVELRPNDQRHVSLRQRQAPGRARVQWVAVRHHALPHRSGYERDPGRVHKRPNLVLGVGVRGPLPEHDERALCVAQQADGGAELLGGGAQGLLEPPRRVEGPDVDELFEEGTCLCFGDLLVQDLYRGERKIAYETSTLWILIGARGLNFSRRILCQVADR